MAIRRIVTLHAPIEGRVAYEALGRIERFITDQMGAQRTWVAHDKLPDLVVMADIPEQQS